jgi:hypothetical protein
MFTSLKIIGICLWEITSKLMLWHQLTRMVEALLSLMASKLLRTHSTIIYLASLILLIASQSMLMIQTLKNNIHTTKSINLQIKYFSLRIRMIDTSFHIRLRYQLMRIIQKRSNFINAFFKREHGWFKKDRTF